jgi:SAM-dependent methyltransferase
MLEHQLEKVRNLYSTNLLENGVESRSVGWNSEVGHHLRFEKLCSFIRGDIGPISINDYGCGYGALLDFLSKHARAEVVKYHGYDICAEMLNAAKEKLKWYEGSIDLILDAEVKTKADYSIVSGTFNVKFDSTDEDWTLLIIEKLAMLNEMSTKGFSFNLLTSYVDWKEPHLFYADPCFWFDYCKRNFSKKVSLLHDYDLWEWTISVTKA